MINNISEEIPILRKSITKIPNNKIENNLLLRILCGQLYEFSEDIPKMLGKKYRFFLEMYPNYELLKKELNSNLIKDFNEIKVRHIDF